MPPGYRADEAPEAVERTSSLGDRVLACLVTWVTGDGTVVEPTTADIAARLRITPRSDERDELNHVLTALRKRGALRYEHDPETRELRWRLTSGGSETARGIPTGTSGRRRRLPD